METKGTEMSKTEFTESEYHALRQMARHYIGLCYPGYPSFEDEVLYIAEDFLVAAHKVDMRALRMLAAKREIIMGARFLGSDLDLMPQYALSAETFDQILDDLEKERK